MYSDGQHPTCLVALLIKLQKSRFGKSVYLFIREQRLFGELAWKSGSLSLKGYKKELN